MLDLNTIEVERPERAPPNDSGGAGALVLYDAACRAVAEAKSVDEAREIRDRAEAMRAYARMANNRTLEIDAAEIRLRAERRIGELMTMQRETVGLAQGKRTDLGPNRTQVERPTLSEAGIDKHLADRARKLAAVPEEKFESAVADWRERIADENARVTTSLLLEGERARGAAKSGMEAALAGFTGNNEWYTPAEWIERARAAMGGIDCDPATSAMAQKIIRADTWFDREKDGLAHSWRGNVWLNPPYARGLIERFIEKLIVERPNFRQAIVLIDNRTDTQWFHSLCSVASAVAFTKGRIGFYNEEVECSSPANGSTLVYVGDHPEKFAKAFAAHCLVLHARSAG